MEQLTNNLAWYLGCGLFQSGIYTILARDDDFSNVELEFVKGRLENKKIEYILNNNTIKIKNDKSN